MTFMPFCSVAISFADRVLILRRACTQLPLRQEFEAHTLPQAPQFWGSLLTLVHAPPQHVLPVTQTPNCRLQASFSRLNKLLHPLTQFALARTGRSTQSSTQDPTSSCAAWMQSARALGLHTVWNGSTFNVRDGFLQISQLLGPDSWPQAASVNSGKAITQTDREENFFIGTSRPEKCEP